MSANNKNNTASNPIAIVGLGCIFPKAGDRQSFWRVLRTGTDCIGPVPPTHWSVNDLYDGDHSSPDRCYAKVGGFLEPYPFDPTEFNIPPNVLEATDTSQLLGLVGAKAALEDAGYGKDGRELPKDKTSVILGVTGALELVIPLGARLGHPRWRKALAQAGIDKETSEKIIAEIADSYVPWQENSFPGLLGNVVSGRIANRLDLHGTNCAVDAACASSLAAVHLAVSELQAGQADVVLTGGTDTFNDIFMFTCFSKTPALSDSGRIAPFSESCDGTLLGEGIGVLVLKRLADAERDGDRIYAVIKGMGSSSDGNSGAIYAPSAPGQAIALRRAYEDSMISPATVKFSEAHGTGTKVGDVVEFSSLNEVYSEAGAELGSCALGTVKSQIGHTKAAAGAASLCKASLSLYHKVFLPTLNITKPNPKLEIEKTPFYLNNYSRPWISDAKHPRRAGVSAFGFGGSNFHAVLEEYKSEKTEPSWDGSVQIWPFSADTKENLAAYIRSAADCQPYESSWKAACARKEFKSDAAFRAVIITGSADYTEKLQKAADAIENGTAMPEDAFFGDSSSELGKVAFLFPGQGSQYLRMGSEIFTIFPEALETLECAERVLKEKGQAPAGYIFPVPHFAENEEDENNKALTNTKITQPCLGAMESAMAAVLERFGVKPQAMAGHSYGELVALHRAGVYTQSDLFALSALRGSLMAAGDGGRGAMSAVAASLKDIEEIVAQVGDGLVLANRNNPTQGVISGPKEAVAKAEEICKSRKFRATRLSVSAAFHSSLLQSARDPFFEALTKTEFKAPEVPVYADMTGRPYGSDADANRTTLADQLLNSVHFIDIIENMYADGFRTFIEVGPKTVLTGLVKKILGKQAHTLLSTDGRKGGGELKCLAQTLSQLAALGYKVNFEAWEEPASEPRHKRMSVPICGANYRAPGKKSQAPLSDPIKPAENYQPIKFVSDNPPILPAPSVPELKTIEFDAPKETEESKLPEANTEKIEIKAEEAKKNNPEPVKADLPQQPAAVQPAAVPYVQSSVLMEAFKAIQSGLNSMQVLQQQTAAAHMRFLESQEQIQRSLQTIVAAQQGLAQASFNPQASYVQVPAFIPQPQIQFVPYTEPAAAKAYAAPEPKAEKPEEKAAPKVNYSTDKPIASPISSIKEETEKKVNTSLRLSKAPEAEENSSAAAAVLSVVSEMTGYPAAMLSLDMNLETDLGIDSIKRVEILSAIQKSIPQAKAITPDEIGTLQTLRSVAERLSGKAAAAEAPAEAAAKAASALNSDAEAVIMKVVTETTGYPQEAVSLDMDLENDLGVDSIKRVEILAAIQKRLPQAAPVTPDELSSLHTLRQILDKLGGSKAEEKAQTAEASSDISEVIASIVSDMTGYPKETLNPDMDLENDLGIDSIKRVEILAAVQKALPNAKNVTPDELGSLHTLKDIASRLGAQAVSEKAAENISENTSADTSSAVMQVVSEMTGYPIDTINLDMDLENDLGIDSIKRVEILAAVQKALPNAKNVTPDELGSLRTLKDITARLGSTDSAAAKTSQVSSASAASETVMQVISDMTGYPKDTITEDMDLENDLGIDSIKRVEILAAVQKALPDAKNVTPDELSSLRTIKDIISRLSQNPEDPSDPSGSKKKILKKEAKQPAGASALEGSRLMRRQLDYVPAERPADKAEEISGLYMILGEGALSQELKKSLIRENKTVRTVSLEEAAQKLDLEKVPEAVIAVMPASAAASEEKLYNSAAQSIRDLKTAFAAVRTLCRRLRELKGQPKLFVTVTGLDGRFGSSEKSFNPISAGIHGITRVFSQEYEGCICRSLDIAADTLNTKKAAAEILSELSVRGSSEVGISAEGRCIAELREELVNLNGTPKIDSSSVIIVTGGARGVTAECAKVLAKACAPKLVLVGRSPKPEAEAALTASAAGAKEIKTALYADAKANGKTMTPKQLEAECRKIMANREALNSIKEIEALGSEVLYISCDVKDKEAVKNIVSLTHKHFGKVSGLIHGAGVLADRFIADKTDEQFSSVFDTKIDGLFNFCSALKEDELKFILTFSSVSARFGRPGQCDYAIANEVMNKFTHFFRLHNPQTACTALGWGPWEGGMVDENLKRVFNELGVEVITRDRGSRALAAEAMFGPEGAFELIMGEGFDVIKEVSRVNLGSFRREINADRFPFLKDHVINGNAVMPIALMTEMAFEEAAFYHPEKSAVSIKDLRILKPITLKSEQASVLEIKASESKASKDEICLELIHETEGQKPKKCVTCTAVLGSFNSVKAPKYTQTAESMQTVSEFSSQESIYKSGYLFHGSSLQAITSALKAENILSLSVHKSEKNEAAEKCSRYTDILYTDCALQGGLIWSGIEYKNCSLPMFIGEYSQYQTEFSKDSEIKLIVKENTPQQITADIYLIDKGTAAFCIKDARWTISPSLKSSFRKNKAE